MPSIFPIEKMGGLLLPIRLGTGNPYLFTGWLCNKMGLSTANAY